MNLRQVLPEIAGSSKHPAPTISICYFNGRLSFNPATCELLGLHKGDPIAFYQDEESPDTWYFAKEDIPGAIRLTMTNGATLACGNTGIARKILTTFGFHESQRFYVDPMPIENKYLKILANKPIKAKLWNSH